MDVDKRLELHRMVMKENIVTVLAAGLCVAGLAIGTGSLHSLWGLLILMNITTVK